MRIDYWLYKSIVFGLWVLTGNILLCVGVALLPINPVIIGSIILVSIAVSAGATAYYVDDLHHDYEVHIPAEKHINRKCKYVQDVDGVIRVKRFIFWIPVTTNAKTIDEFVDNKIAYQQKLSEHSIGEIREV